LTHQTRVHKKRARPPRKKLARCGDFRYGEGQNNRVSRPIFGAGSIPFQRYDFVPPHSFTLITDPLFVPSRTGCSRIEERLNIHRHHSYIIMVIWKDHSKQQSCSGNGNGQKKVAGDDSWQQGASVSFSPSTFFSKATQTTTTDDKNDSPLSQVSFYLQRRAAIDAHQGRFRTFSKQLKDVANIFRQLQKARIAYDIAQGKVRKIIYTHFC
jgi:hypothetical protein